MLDKDNYIIADINVQEELIDVASTGEVLPWREKKLKNLMVSKIYKSVDKKKSFRLKRCATFLQFKLDALGKKRLISANFCKVRLCPMCTWRRSLKIFSQVSKIINHIQLQGGSYEYLFLTLTIKNCEGNELSETLDRLFCAWKKFCKFKIFKSTVQGWYRGLEVTHNLSMNTYHPHFHCILLVKRSYFKGKNYLTQAEWTCLWKDALGVDYTPMVNIKKTYGSTSNIISEVAKYSVKDADYVRPENWDLSVEILRILDTALVRRRLVSFGGKFKESHRELNLGDAVDGDLVHVSEESSEGEKDELILSYVWNVGYQQYRLAE